MVFNYKKIYFASMYRHWFFQKVSFLLHIGWPNCCFSFSLKSTTVRPAIVYYMFAQDHINFNLGYVAINIRVTPCIPSVVTYAFETQDISGSKSLPDVALCRLQNRVFFFSFFISTTAVRKSIANRPGKNDRTTWHNDTITNLESFCATFCNDAIDSKSEKGF